MTEVDHKKRKAGGIGDSSFFDIHEIFQVPILLGVAEIEFDWESQAVELDGLTISNSKLALNKMTCAWALVFRLVF